MTADGDPDFLGPARAAGVPPSRIVMRTCAAPRSFAAPMPPTAVTCCKETDAEAPGERGRPRAGARHRRGPAGAEPRPGSASRPRCPPPRPRCRRPDAHDAADVVPARRDLADPDPPSPGRPFRGTRWSTSRPGAATDPGPCVELAGARRAGAGVVPDRPGRHEPGPDDGVHATVRRRPARARQGPEQRRLPGADRADPGRGHRRRRAYLQGLRFDVRPEGPEMDGVDRRGRARPLARRDRLRVVAVARGLLLREDAPRDECCAAARCPRLPDAGSQHLCFGLPQHGFAPVCASGCRRRRRDVDGATPVDRCVGPARLCLDLLQWPRCACTPPPRWA